VVEHFVKKQNRRRLLVGSLRYAVLSLFGFIAGSAFTKRRRLLREGICINQGICGGCELYEDCQQPQALSRRQVLAKKTDE
jgi:hypothetical protein